MIDDNGGMFKTCAMAAYIFLDHFKFTWLVTPKLNVKCIARFTSVSK